MSSVEFGRDRGGHRVGVDVEQGAGFVAGQRADDRHEPIVELLPQNVRLDGVYVADEAVVDRIGALALDGRTPMRSNQAGVDAADTDRGNLQVTAGCKHPGIDLPVQNHHRDVERRTVRHAPTVDERRVEPEFRREFGRLRTTAMNQNHAYADLVQDADLFHQRACLNGIGEHFAAGFQDEHLALE